MHWAVPTPKAAPTGGGQDLNILPTPTPMDITLGGYNIRGHTWCGNGGGADYLHEGTGNDRHHTFVFTVDGNLAPPPSKRPCKIL